LTHVSHSSFSFWTPSLSTVSVVSAFISPKEF